MPKCISRKDSRKVYVAFKVCENSNRMSVYSDVKAMCCQLNPISGSRSIEYYGQTIQYNAVALFNVDENSKYIDVATKFWFKSKPVDSTLTSAEYEVTGKSKPMDGIIKVYLSECKQNNNLLYVAYQGNVCSLTINYNSEEKVAHLPKDFYFPFTSNDVFWERKPKSFSDRENTLYIRETVSDENGVTLYFAERQ